MKVIVSILLIACLLTGCAGRPEENRSSSSSSQSSSSSSTGLHSAIGMPSDNSSSSSSQSETNSSSSSSSQSVSGEPVIDKNDWRLVLVNYKHVLEEDYDVELEVIASPYQFDKRAIDDFRAMLEAAKADGITLSICSTYRPFSSSERLYNNQVAAYMNQGMDRETAEVEAAKLVAPPGKSEHNTGLAADIVSVDYFTRFGDFDNTIDDLPEFEWLRNNAADYGFILRYPKGKEEITGISYEPWHYRYVGVEHAKVITEKGLCLEEYLDMT